MLVINLVMTCWLSVGLLYMMVQLTPFHMITQIIL